ncbi:SsgA family sporulation/cell division regulator [Streptomyces sp. NPDC006261]|uniref:SsgA family sporulation/cell division regulator n=1 Tax=Streptomyces sp. NPDC006261 TaxID=3156739 RepID=UPI00339F4347
MIIRGTATDGAVIEPSTSLWSHDPKDPWAVVVRFTEHEVTWNLSLDLLLDAFASPPGTRFGSGDFGVELDGDSALLYLKGEWGSATMKFPSKEIQEFLNQIDDQDSEEFVAQELENFLEAL